MEREKNKFTQSRKGPLYSREDSLAIRNFQDILWEDPTNILYKDIGTFT